MDPKDDQETFPRPRHVRNTSINPHLLFSQLYSTPHLLHCSTSSLLYPSSTPPALPFLYPSYSTPPALPFLYPFYCSGMGTSVSCVYSSLIIPCAVSTTAGSPYYTFAHCLHSKPYKYNAKSLHTYSSKCRDRDGLLSVSEFSALMQDIEIPGERDQIR
jgi:hypothetical protein